MGACAPSPGPNIEPPLVAIRRKRQNAGEGVLIVASVHLTSAWVICAIGRSAIFTPLKRVDSTILGATNLHSVPGTDNPALHHCHQMFVLGLILSCAPPPIIRMQYSLTSPQTVPRELMTLPRLPSRPGGGKLPPQTPSHRRLDHRAVGAQSGPASQYRPRPIRPTSLPVYRTSYAVRSAITATAELLVLLLSQVLAYHSLLLHLIIIQCF